MTSIAWQICPTDRHSSLIHNEAEAKIAFIFDKESDLLLGDAAIGSDAGAWIDVFSLVIFNKMTHDQFAHYIYAFPTTTCGPLIMLEQIW